LQTKEKQKNINQIEKPLYEKKWFIISLVIFFISSSFVLVVFGEKQAQVQTQEFVPTNQISQATTTATTTEKINYDALLKSLQKKASSVEIIPVQNTPQEKNIADIIAEWQDRVARVECIFGMEIAQGSATIAKLNYKDGTLALTAITNKHVLDDNNNMPRACVIGVYGGGSRTVEDPNAFQWGTLEDYGYINLDKASKFDETKWASKYSKDFKTCSSSEINLGDSLLVLGYPTIGTKNGLTVTKGIISGIEQDYYVTDAKIDHGNSGGTAILLKDDCYLGIPSSSVTGEIESMGRILKASFVIN